MTNILTLSSYHKVPHSFPTMFSAEEMAVYEAAVLGNLGVIKSHLDIEMNKLRIEQSTMKRGPNW